jgi:N-acyl-D-amino-acid deacylase
MEEAIYKMTGMPALRMGIKNRGKIAIGMAADLLVFDSEKFTDNADYSNSTLLATGMGTVILNGQVVYNGNTFHNRNGRGVSRHKE